MRIKNVMSRGAATCLPTASLEEAARVMWDRDCGFLPVTEEDGTLCGVLTDRDALMACYGKGHSPADVRVSGPMTMEVHAVKEDDSVAKAHETMRVHQVRRLPVVDAQNRVVGVVSLNDLALHAAHEGLRRERDDVAETLAAICRHRELVPA